MYHVAVCHHDVIKRRYIHSIHIRTYNLAAAFKTDCTDDSQAFGTQLGAYYSSVNACTDKGVNHS